MQPRTMYSRVSVEADLDRLANPRQVTGVALRAAPGRVRREAALPSRRRAEMLVDAVFAALKE